MPVHGTENKHEIQTDKAIGAEGSNTEDLTSTTDPLLQKLTLTPAPLAPDAPGRLCGVPLWDLHGRSRSRSFLSRLKCQCCLMTMLRSIRRGRERGLARNPAFQEGTQPREEGGAESQCFSSSLYPDHPSQATQESKIPHAMLQEEPRPPTALQ